MIYRDGVDDGLKVTLGGSVPEDHEAGTVIKSQRRRKDPKKIPKEKLPIWDGTIGKPIS